MTDLKEIINHLSKLVTEERYQLFNTVLEHRTRYVTVVLEDIYQPHNASAVLRTSDCFGIQDVHIIENRNTYNINPDVALGSYKWINLIKHNEKEQNTVATIHSLKKKGYRIVATTPHTNDISLDEFDLSKGKVALFFGTEMQGLSNTMLENADEYLKIPMYGFTESFNISVSASIILHKLRSNLLNSKIVWKLSDKEKDEIIFKWLFNTIKRSNVVVKELSNKFSFNYSELSSLL